MTIAFSLSKPCAFSDEYGTQRKKKSCLLFSNWGFPNCLRFPLVSFLQNFACCFRSFTKFCLLFSLFHSTAFLYGLRKYPFSSSCCFKGIFFIIKLLSFAFSFFWFSVFINVVVQWRLLHCSISRSSAFMSQQNLPTSVVRGTWSFSEPSWTLGWRLEMIALCCSFRWHAKNSRWCYLILVKSDEYLRTDYSKMCELSSISHCHGWCMGMDLRTVAKVNRISIACNVLKFIVIWGMYSKCTFVPQKKIFFFSLCCQSWN